MSDPEIERLHVQLKERDDLLAFVAHELRNPLHTLGIQLSSVRLAAQAMGPTAAGAVERVRKAQVTLARYTERMTLLLDLARHDVKAFSVSLENVDVAVMLRQLVVQYADEAEYSGTRLNYLGPASRFLHSDLQALEHILGNLLSNAFKYAAASEVIIDLQNTDGGQVEIAVIDNGVGIALEMQQYIFDKFRRGGSMMQHSGYGLGLWIASRLTEALGGQITLESTLGQGSCFTLRFPPFRRKDD